MLYCNNKTTGFHSHPTTEEALRCWGTPVLYVVGGTAPSTPPLPHTGTTPAALAPWAIEPPPTPKPRWYDEPSTGSQWWRVEKEGGSKKRAKTLTKGQCSQYIDALKYGRCAKEPDPPGYDEDEDVVYSAAHNGLIRISTGSALDTTKSASEVADIILKSTLPTAVPPPPAPSRHHVHGHWVAKKETIVMIPLLERVPDGRYAVGMADESPTFLRVSRPDRGKWQGCLKVQTQHGDRYEDAWCKWDDGQIGVFKASVEDFINVLITDYRGAARRYAQIRRRCARCGIELTDERSLHYSIGPECEKYWPWMIDMVDEEEALRKAEA